MINLRCETECSHRRCKNRKCPGTWITDNGGSIICATEHIHPPDYNVVKGMQLKSQMYQKAVISKETSFTILNNAIKSESIDITHKLPQIKSIVYNISRKRRKILNYSQQVSSNLIKDEFKLTN
jgi:hypothetical protein